MEPGTLTGTGTGLLFSDRLDINFNKRGASVNIIILIDFLSCPASIWGRNNPDISGSPF